MSFPARKSMIRLAYSLPQGSQERRDLLQVIARFPEGAEGTRKFEEWFAEQPGEFQREWEENKDQFDIVDGEIVRKASHSKRAKGSHHVAPNGDVFVDTAFINSVSLSGTWALVSSTQTRLEGGLSLTV